MNTLPTWAYVIGGLFVAIGPVLTAIGLLRKGGTEARRITVDTVDVNVKIAGELRDDAISDRQAARAELLQLRSDFEAHRTETDLTMSDLLTELSELHTELRGERAEKQALAAQNATLIARVDELEAEVARLKANQS